MKRIVLIILLLLAYGYSQNDDNAVFIFKGDKPEQCYKDKRTGRFDKNCKKISNDMILLIVFDDDEDADKIIILTDETRSYKVLKAEKMDEGKDKLVFLIKDEDNSSHFVLSYRPDYDEFILMPARLRGDGSPKILPNYVTYLYYQDYAETTVGELKKELED